MSDSPQEKEIEPIHPPAVPQITLPIVAPAVESPPETQRAWAVPPLEDNTSVDTGLKTDLSTVPAVESVPVSLQSEALAALSPPRANTRIIGIPNLERSHCILRIATLLN